MTIPYDKLAQEFCQKIEPILANRRARTFPAKILDEDDAILSQGEARLENESNPSIYYPEHGKVIPREVVARAKWVELTDEKKSKVRIIEGIRLCERGSEIHYHFSYTP